MYDLVLVADKNCYTSRSCKDFEKRPMYYGVSAADFKPWIREVANVSLADVILGAKGKGAAAVDLISMRYSFIFVSCILAI